jgi:hypothetical protein
VHPAGFHPPHENVVVLEQKAPTSASSWSTFTLDAPIIRVVVLMLLPSTGAERIAAFSRQSSHFVLPPDFIVRTKFGSVIT